VRSAFAADGLTNLSLAAVPWLHIAAAPTPVSAALLDIALHAPLKAELVRRVE